MIGVSIMIGCATVFLGLSLILWYLFIYGDDER